MGRKESNQTNKQMKSVFRIQLTIGRLTKIWSVKLKLFSYLSVLTYVWGALIETVLWHP